MKVQIDTRLLAFPAGVLLVIIVVFITFHDWSRAPQPTLERIRKEGEIRLLTDNSSNTYYIYRERPMGFEYELAKQFADYLGVELKVYTPGWNDLIPFLLKNRGDFIAAGMTATDRRKAVVDFSDPYMKVQQRIIRHKLVFGLENIADMEGRIFHVRRGTSYQGRLEEIRDSGVDLKIELHDNVATEELIRKVARRKIAFTVADSNIALLNRRYYPDIKIGLPLHQEQSLAWAVRKDDRAFLEKMNDFLEKLEEDGGLSRLFEKYYGDVEVFDYFDLKKFHERIVTRLPEFIHTIKEESAKAGFDWRLMAALVYQESHFNPKAESYTGVRGLMQVTQTTAEEMGIEDRLDPIQSIRAGIRYLNKLFDRFDDIESREQRLLFAMGSYNIGYGHIRDAQKIAVEEGLEADMWSSMKSVLPYLMKRSYYLHTEHGYARGREAVRYVDRILTYYDILKQKP